jgi:hypothetical protein
VLWNLFQKMQYKGENFVWKHYDKLSSPNTTVGGFYTNIHSKKMLLTTGIEWLRQRLWEIRSPEFLNEMPSFTRDMDTASVGGASRGAHDDCIIAGLLAIFGAHDDDFNPETGRISIPDSRLYMPEKADEEKVIWTCRCTCGNTWETGRRPGPHDRCQSCNRAIHSATKAPTSRKSFVEPRTVQTEITGMLAGVDYMEL